MPLSSADMRALFPIAGRFAYLDHAGQAPLSVPVRSAMEVFTRRLAEEPFDRAHWLRLREQARAQVAQLIDVPSESIAFVRNTTDGLGLVACGLQWREGDNVVGVDGEFPSNVYTWMGLRTRGVDLRLAPLKEGRVDVKGLVGCCDQRTRLVAVSLVQFSNGFRCDIEALGSALHRRGILLVVDGVQAVGALEIHARKLPIDFLSAGAQKWMLGPMGIGFAYVPPSLVDQLQPASIGVDSVVNDEEFFQYDLTLKPDAHRFEDSCPNLGGILGMGTSVSLLLRAGPAVIESHVLRLADRLRSELPLLGYEILPGPKAPAERSPIVSFRHPRMVPDELAGRLRDARVIVARRGNFLRASPHYYNEDEDINRLLESLPH